MIRVTDGRVFLFKWTQYFLIPECILYYDNTDQTPSTTMIRVGENVLGWLATALVESTEAT
jgi:hypothetical protein